VCKTYESSDENVSEIGSVENIFEEAMMDMYNYPQVFAFDS